MFYIDLLLGFYLLMCRGFLLPASHVIHTVGPIYDVDSNPAASLASAYR